MFIIPTISEAETNCATCDCLPKIKDHIQWVKDYNERYNRPQTEEEKAELANLQAELAKVSLDPNLTIVTGGHQYCICSCHGENGRVTS